MIDTHAHLDHLENLEQALERAAAAGVEAIVGMSMDLASCRKNLDIAGKYASPKIYLALGMHPSEANEDDLPGVIELIKERRARLCAVGEIGLDFWYKWVRKDQGQKDKQMRVYRALLETAKEAGLPAVVHARGAWRECLDLALEVGVKKVNFHWYSGPVDVLDDIMSAGYYVSTGPSVAYSPPSQEAMLAAPVERTLIETDCPVYYRNKITSEEFQAEPKDVARALKGYCALKQMDEAEANEILTRNAREFFGITG